MRPGGLVTRTWAGAGLLTALIGVVWAAWVPLALVLQPAADPVHRFASGELWARWATLLVNTVVVVAVALAVAVPIATVLAMQAFKWRWAGARWLAGLIVVTAAIPTYVTFAAFVAVTGVGWARESAWAAGVIAGTLHIPLAALFIGIGLRGVERELEEAALLVMPPRQVAWRVSLRRAAWSVLAAAGIVAWLIGTDYAITDIVQVRTFAEEIYTEYGAWGPAARPLRIAAPLLGMLGIAGTAGVWWALRRGRLLLQAPRGASLRFDATRPGVGRWLALAGLLIAVAWPLADVFRRIGSAEHLSRLLVTFAPEWQRTMIVAMCTAVATATAGTILAWVIVRRPWARWLVVAGLLVLLTVPAPALAIALVWTLSAAVPEALLGIPGVDAVWRALGQLRDHRIAMHVLGIGLRFLPVAVALIAPGLATIPRELNDAARLDGAGWWRRLVDLHLPLARGRVLLATVVVGLLAIGELDCAHMVAPPDGELLSIRLATFIHNGVDADVAAVCLAATISTVLPAAAAWRVWGRES